MFIFLPEWLDFFHQRQPVLENDFSVGRYTFRKLNIYQPVKRAKYYHYLKYSLNVFENFTQRADENFSLWSEHLSHLFNY